MEKMIFVLENKFATTRFKELRFKNYTGSKIKSRPNVEFFELNNHRNDANTNQVYVNDLCKSWLSRPFSLEFKSI
jgi:hypothetical protein